MPTCLYSPLFVLVLCLECNLHLRCFECIIIDYMKLSQLWLVQAVYEEMHLLVEIIRCICCLTVDQKRQASGLSPKLMLPKPGQSGLRPPGFSHLPPARLAAFGFVRSASVSSVSSNQSNDSTHSDPCRSSRECYNSSRHVKHVALAGEQFYKSHISYQVINHVRSSVFYFQFSARF